MKKNLGNDFEEAFQIALESENIEIQIKQLKEKQKQLKDIAIKKMNSIRLEKVEDLQNKLKNHRIKINKILKQRESIVKEYCKNNGHNFIEIKTKTIGQPKYHSFKQGDVYDSIVTFKCSVCGEISKIKTISNSSLFKNESYKCVIPEKCLNTIHSKNGKTFIELTEELKQTLIKEKYISLVLEEMCKIFGHDAIIVNPSYDAYSEHRTYKCKCCGKILGKKEYETNYSNAPYKGIVDYKGYNYKSIKYSDLEPIIDLSTIDFNKIEESIVIPGTKCEEEEKEKQLKKIRKSTYFDFSSSKIYNNS